MKGVIDRFSDNNQAVILIEEIGKELIVAIADLPTGSKEGMWLHIEQQAGEYKIISIDKETTEKQKEKAMDLMAKLRAKGGGSKFKRK